MELLYADTSEAVWNASLTVHKQLGPGLLESVYERCLAFELVEQGHKVDVQKPIPLIYRNLRFDCAYRADLIVDDKVLVELKAVEELLPLHQAQLMTYLKLAQLRVGLLINFNVPLLKQGFKRIIL